MYSLLLFFHSIFRWLVLISLTSAIIRAYTGLKSGKQFDKTDNALRHWTATIVHIQLMAGFTLYFISPLIKAFQHDFKHTVHIMDLAFFGIVHISLMLIAVIIVTIGSALTKRRETDKEKFRTMLLWFSIALFIIFLAIPWPFSPFAHRSYFRPL